jgi:uncharacterized protein YecE (DUF72 family)
VGALEETPGEGLTGYTVAKVYAGTSGWAYPSWKPDFYPAKLPSAKFLSYYASRLNTVEVNYTFRRFPTEKLLRSWVETTPSDFKFSVKANQKITHVARLRDVAEFTSEFLRALQPLDSETKLGPVLFQLPPFLRCDAALLKDFLAGLPRSLHSAFEFRHASWFCEEVHQVMGAANVALCQAESEKLETPDVQTADFAYLRLRKAEYSPDERKQLIRRVSDLASRGHVFVYFKHEETAEGALYAEEILAATKSK